MSLKCLNITLADDDMDDCHFFKLALDEMAVPTHFTYVEDGEKIMHFLEDEPDPFPDVIFLDLNMPRKNGFECLSEIKSDKKLNKIPIIIFSTSIDRSVINELYENGAHYFIRKPSDFIQFKKIIQNLLLNYIAAGNTQRPTKEKFVITANAPE